MITDHENQVGSYHRSISWQITHTINQMSPAKREAFLERMVEQEALNHFLGKPVNKDLLDVAVNALAGSELKCQNFR